ncbi:MAG: adenylate/guanylate cyclase domain-containing protein [Candidatus Berkiella sp.]
MLTSILKESDDDVADTLLAQEIQALDLSKHDGALVAPIPLRASGSLPVLNEKSAAPHIDSASIHLEGDYQQAVFLFTDLKNFTTISQKMRPQELVEILNPIYSTFQSIIDKYGTPVGITTVKWESDCLMLCGSRNESLENAKNQVKAMLYIAHSFSQFVFTYNKQVTGHSFDFCFGIHVGPASKTQVRLKNSGMDPNIQIDWFGETVNKASRMESSSHPYQAQVTEDVYVLAKKYFEFTEAHPRTIKSYGEVLTRFIISPISTSLKHSAEASSSSELPRKPMPASSTENNAQRTSSASITPLFVRGSSRSQPKLSQDDSSATFSSPVPRFIKSPQADPMVKIISECHHAVFLFADIKGFTLLSKRMSSCELVQQLDPIYAAFEKIIILHGAPVGIKIVKWAGDCIMLCGHTDEETDEQINKQASTMLYIGYLLSQFMSSYNKKMETQTIDFRFGISIGRATQIRLRIKEANGKIRESFDWFGEAVSKASRMEASSHPNQVQVTKELFEMTKGNFTFTEPLVRQIKSHGEITTRFLYGPRRKFSNAQTQGNEEQDCSTASKETSRKLLGSSRSSSSNK